MLIVLQVGRVFGWQLPGRRFFVWWCGGMSVGEVQRPRACSCSDDRLH